MGGERESVCVKERESCSSVAPELRRKITRASREHFLRNAENMIHQQLGAVSREDRSGTCNCGGRGEEEKAERGREEPMMSG